VAADNPSNVTEERRIFFIGSRPSFSRRAVTLM